MSKITDLELPEAEDLALPMPEGFHQTYDAVLQAGVQEIADAACGPAFAVGSGNYARPRDPEPDFEAGC